MVRTVLTVEQFAEEMQISLPTAYGIIHSHNAPPIIKIGRVIRIPVASFEKWLNEKAEEGEEI